MKLLNLTFSSGILTIPVMLILLSRAKGFPIKSKSMSPDST